MSHWTRRLLTTLAGVVVGVLTFQAFSHDRPDPDSATKDLPRILVDQPLTAIRGSSKPRIDPLRLATGRILLAQDKPAEEQIAALRAQSPNLSDIQGLLKKLCEDDLSAALEFSLKLWAEDGVRDFAAEYVLKRMAKTDPAAAFNSLLGIDPPPSAIERIKVELGTLYAEAAPEDAIKAIEAWSPRQRLPIMGRAISTIALENPQRAMELVPEDGPLAALVITLWLQTNPDEAMDKFETLPEGATRNQALREIATHVHISNEDFEVTKTWIAELDEDDRENAVEAVAQSLWMDRDLEKIFELDQLYTNPNRRDVETLNYALYGGAAELNTLANWLYENERLSDPVLSSVLFSRFETVAPAEFQSFVSALPDGSLKSRLQRTRND